MGLYDFRPCSRGRLLMVLLPTAIPSLSNYIKSLLHEALLFFNAIALIFRSSLGVVFHLRLHFPPLICQPLFPIPVFFLQHYQFESIHLIPWLCLSVSSHCAWVNQWFVLFFWDQTFTLSDLFNFVKQPVRLPVTIRIPLNSQENVQNFWLNTKIYKLLYTKMVHQAQETTQVQPNYYILIFSCVSITSS